MTRVFNSMTSLLEYMMGIFMSALIIINFMHVVLRYAFNNPTSWSSEISRFIMIWMTFTGATIATKYCTHLTMGFTVHRFVNKFYGSIIKIIVNVIIAITIFILAYYSAKITLISGHRIAPMTRIPMYYPWAALPVNSIIIGILLTDQIVKEIKTIISTKKIMRK